MFYAVETCNFDSDHPDEKFLSLTDADSIPQVVSFNEQLKAQSVVDSLNSGANNSTPRWWKVVREGYVLKPAFSP